MKFPKRWTTVIALGAAVLSPTAARAQGYNSEIRIDQMQPPSSFSPFTRAEGPHDRFDEGIAYAFRIIGEYANEPLRSRVVGGADDGTEISPVAHALLVHVGAALSPIDWLNIELGMPFAVFEDGEPNELIPQQTIEAGESHIGDLRLGVHGRPYSTKAFDLELGARFWAPTGDSAAYMGGPERFFRLEAVLSGAGEVDPLVYGCSLGVAPLIFAGRDGDRAALSCAALFNITPMVALGVEPHVALFTYAPPDGRGEHAPGISDGTNLRVQFEPLAAFQLHFSGFTLGVAGGPGIGDAPGTASGRAMLLLSYAARGERVADEDGPKDTDLDGIPDELDACPDAAGSEERRGCPEKQDRDGDGIVEGDACPDKPGARYDDPEANGCPDRDNDHVADPVDPCPLEPSPGTDGCPLHARLADMDGTPRFDIDPPIVFPKRSAKLPAEGVAALKEIIATLRANPKLKHISVSVGMKKAPQKLTDDRAKAILVLFSDQNVDSNRYEVVLSDDLEGGDVSVRIIQ